MFLSYREKGDVFFFITHGTSSFSQNEGGTIGYLPQNPQFKPFSCSREEENARARSLCLKAL